MLLVHIAGRMAHVRVQLSLCELAQQKNTYSGRQLVRARTACVRASDAVRQTPYVKRRTSNVVRQTPYVGLVDGREQGSPWSLGAAKIRKLACT